MIVSPAACVALLSEVVHGGITTGNQGLRESWVESEGSGIGLHSTVQGAQPGGKWEEGEGGGGAYWKYGFFYGWIYFANSVSLLLSMKVKPTLCWGGVSG